MRCDSAKLRTRIQSANKRPPATPTATCPMRRSYVPVIRRSCASVQQASRPEPCHSSESSDAFNQQVEPTVSEENQTQQGEDPTAEPTPEPKALLPQPPDPCRAVRRSLSWKSAVRTGTPRSLLHCKTHTPRTGAVT